MAAVAASVIGAIGGGLVNSSGAHKANRTNLQLQRRAQQFDLQMSNTAVQRRMADLRAAGINPILAGRDGASAPTTSPPTMQNELMGLGTGISAASSAAASMKQTKATTELTEAQTDKTRTETEIAKAGLPYSAQNAHNTSKQLNSAMEKLASEANEAFANWRGKELDNEQKVKMNKLYEEHQQLMNQAIKAGIPEKEAEARFYDEMPAAKWLQLIKILFKD